MSLPYSCHSPSSILSLESMISFYFLIQHIKKIYTSERRIEWQNNRKRFWDNWKSRFLRKLCRTTLCSINFNFDLTTNQITIYQEQLHNLYIRSLQRQIEQLLQLIQSFVDSLMTQRDDFAEYLGMRSIARASKRTHVRFIHVVRSSYVSLGLGHTSTMCSTDGTVPDTLVLSAAIWHLTLDAGPSVRVGGQNASGIRSLSPIIARLITCRISVASRWWTKCIREITLQNPRNNSEGRIDFSFFGSWYAPSHRRFMRQFSSMFPRQTGSDGMRGDLSLKLRTHMPEDDML